jgi:Zn-dependent protease
MLGRISLNPFRHIDPVGTVLLPVGMLILMKLTGVGFIFGWAKPVPVDYRNLGNPRRDMGIVALAGPAANLLMMVFWALLMRLAVAIGDSALWIAEPLLLMGGAGVLINAILMVLNLFPLLPLDGGRVLAALLPPKLASSFSRLEPYGLLILVVLLFSGVLGSIIWPVILFVEKLVTAPLGLSEIIYGVQGLIFA